MNDREWAQACRELSSRDSVMAALIREFKGSRMSSRGQPFVTLIRSVVGQQISVKAAEAIWTRFCDLCPNVTPTSILQLTPDELRGVGLSMRKGEYMHSVAQFFDARCVDDDYWASRTDDEIITELSGIRGIGRWSAEMFLMFTLLRPNVFPVDDIGLLRGLEKHYGGERLTPAAAKRQFFEQFSPWNSVATWYLWRSLDPVEVQY